MIKLGKVTKMTKSKKAHWWFETSSLELGPYI